MAHHHHHWIDSSNKKGLFISIILNSIIVIAEFVWWIISWSLALLSDAIHNLSDVASLVLAYIWELLGKKKEDKKHTFAFKRAEVIIAFLNSIALVLIWFYIIYEAVEIILWGWDKINTYIMIVTGLIWFAGNFGSLLFLFKEKDDNLNKKAAYLHIFFDAISTFIVVICWIIIYFTNWYLLDPIASIIISIFVIKSWYELLKDSLHILMQWTPENIDVDKINDYLIKLSWVKEVHDLHIWSIDSNDVFLSAHLVVDKNINKDELIKQINKYLHDNFEIHHTSLQLEEEKCS